MFSIWFFILKASASAILGQSTNAWFKKTKVGIWFYAKVDSFYTWAAKRTLNWAAKRYDIEIATKEERAMKKYPYLMSRINKLEQEVKKLKKK